LDHRRVGFKHTKKIGGTLLAIAEDRKGMGVIPKLQSFLIHLLQAWIDILRDDGQILPVRDDCLGSAGDGSWS
jgi:hypothetical protein